MKSVDLSFWGSDGLYHVSVDGEDLYACKSRAEAILFAEELKCIYAKHDPGISEKFKKRITTLDELAERWHDAE